MGAHLVAHLRAHRPGAVLWGLDRPQTSRPMSGVDEVVFADLKDAGSVREALAAVRPDRIFHLAAQASPRLSWEDPAATFAANVLGLLNLLEALRALGLAPRVLVVGSSEEYGRVDPAHLPLREDAPLHPLSPYAASKVAQGYLAVQYALSAGIPAVVTRTFHHTGPGRGAGFAEASFAEQIAEAEAGQGEGVIEVGNLEAVRDFTDVRDVVRAYDVLVERGAPGECYNVCSGRGVSVREVLDRLIAVSGHPVLVRVDPARLRPSETPVFVGDPGKLRLATGWEPEIPLDRTLADVLEDWRIRVRARTGAPA